VSAQPQFAVGEQVRIGKNSTKHTIGSLKTEKDAAGDTYVMAVLITPAGVVGQTVETSRLRKVSTK